MQLRVSLEKFSGEKAMSFYDTFRIGDQVLIFMNSNWRRHTNSKHLCFQNTFYKLDVSGFHGNGGDGLTSHFNGMAFTTYDQDHDTYRGNCAIGRGEGGWWFQQCGYASLNAFNLGHGEKTSGSMSWYKFGNIYECLKTISMAIRPIEL